MGKNCILDYLFESLFAQSEQSDFPLRGITSTFEVRQLSQRPFIFASSD